MTGIINAAIGLSLTFLLLSMLASAAQEALAGLFNDRGKLLERALVQLLDGVMMRPRVFDVLPPWLGWIARHWSPGPTLSPPKRRDPDGLASHVIDHGLLDGLSRGPRMPSYIPADQFADALIDVLRVRAGEKSPSPGGLAWAIQPIPGKPGRALQTLLDYSAGDVVRFRAALIDWYGDVMDRVSGWYTRGARRSMFLIGLMLAVGLQVNAIGIASELIKNDGLAASYVKAAENKIKTIKPEDIDKQQTLDDVVQLLGSIQQLPAAVGWSWSVIEKDVAPTNRVDHSFYVEIGKLDWRKVGVTFIGWVITALCVAQGAPFWFGLMSQLVNMRASGTPPDQMSAPSGASTNAPAPPWTPSPGGTANVPLGMTADDLGNIQAKLGILPSRLIDDRTASAVRAYQIQHGMSPTGTLDIALAKRILANST